MDIVKTLLVYMTVLLTSSAAMVPGLSPMPAPSRTPAPVVTAAPTLPGTPVPSQALNAIPTPTPQLTVVRLNDRGQNVRSLQARLIELGYLSGEVDGVFGRQTLAAVQAFQKANNLQVDGVAGQQTLSKLYYDDQVVWAPNAQKTRVPTPRPSPTPALASLPVYYVSTTGERLYTEVLTLYQGRTTIRANNERVPQGYVLTGTSQVTVTVSGTGAPNPTSVSFTYQKTHTAPPVTGALVVNYLDEDGNKNLRRENLTLPLGYTQVYANDALVPEGYALVSVRSVDVRVNERGVADPGVVNFVYRKAPVTVMVPVNYVDQQGKVLFNDQVVLSAGTHEVLANSGHVPMGYTLVGEKLQKVTVNQQGQASPPALKFIYAPPQGAQVRVSYMDMQGGLLHEETLILPQGSHPVEAKQEHVPEGYVLQGLSTITVLVDYNGIAMPPAVVFHYLMPASAQEAAKPEADAAQASLEAAAAAAAKALDEAAGEDAEQVSAEAAADIPAQTPDEAADAVSRDPAEKEEQDQEKEPGAEETDQSQEAPETTEVPYFPVYQTLRFNPGSYPVYTGPGEHYYRVDDAVFTSGDCRLYGAQGEWLLMGYGTADGGYRIGYITKDALPEGFQAEELVFAGNPAVLAGPAQLTDDPVVNLHFFATLPAGTPVTVLAFFEENSPFVFVEAEDPEGQPVRGFVDQHLLP